MEKTVITVTEENAAEVLANMEANTVYEISGSLTVPFINVVGSGAEISYVGSDDGTITTTDGTKRGIYIQSGASLTVSGTSKKLTIDMSQSKESRATVDDSATLTLKLTGRFKEKVKLPECKFKEPFEKKFTGWEIDGETYQPAYELTLSENLKVRTVWEDAKLRQTLTFDNEKIEKTFGDTEFRLEPNGAKTNIVYTSSDEKVLTVAEDGTVTIVGAGDAYIKATAQETEEYFSASAQYNVTVYKASFSISASVSDWGYGAEPNDVTVTGNVTDEKPVIEYKAADADDNAYLYIKAKHRNSLQKPPPKTALYFSVQMTERAGAAISRKVQCRLLHCTLQD